MLTRVQWPLLAQVASHFVRKKCWLESVARKFSRMQYWHESSETLSLLKTDRIFAPVEFSYLLFFDF